MIRQSPVRALRLKLAFLLALALCASLFAGMGTAEKSSAYWVCPTNAAQKRPDGFRCQHATYRPKISYVEKLSSPRSYAVYRSSTYRGGSVSGSEFFSSSSDYYLQDFYCNPGYPNAHNRHSVDVWVTYTLAGTTGC